MLLAGLHAALKNFDRTKDRRLVLDPQIEQALANLARIVDDPASDLAAAHTIGQVHWLRYCLLPEGEDRNDLEAAVVWLWPVHRNRPAELGGNVNEYLSGLPVDSLVIRRIESGTAEDLAAAERLLRAALRGDMPPRVRYTELLAEVLRLRAEQSGSLGTLAEALDLAERALAMADEDDPHATIRRSRLGTVLASRAMLLGSRADVDRAVQLLTEVAAAPDADDNRVVHASNLGWALRLRAELFGGEGDLTAAAEQLQAAVDAVPADHPQRGTLLANLANTLRILASRSGDSADADRAVEVARRAVRTPSPEPATNARYADILAVSLSVRFELDPIGHPDDLAEATAMGQRAVDLCPPGHPNRGRVLGNFGDILRLRSDHGDPDTVARWLAVAQAAVEALPAHDVHRGTALNNLANALTGVAERRADPKAAGLAIAALTDAIESAEPDSAERAMFNHNLGNAHRLRYELARDPGDVDAGVRAYRTAIESALPGQAAASARSWAWLAALDERWELAVEGYREMTALLGRAAPRSLTRQDREARLTYATPSPAGCAAACLSAGRLDTAVELFEQQHGILLGDALDLRSDIAELAAAAPDLATRWRETVDDLGALEVTAEMTAGTVEVTAGADRSRLRRERSAALDRVLAEIRALPGFGTFLLPSTVDELRRGLPDGYVVLVVCSALRCDALVLDRHGRLEAIPLPGLTLAAAAERVIQLQAAVAGGTDRWAAEQRIDELLRWLWDVVAEPVVGHLETRRDGSPPRMWWCPSGPLTFLPLHAAGHHDTRFDARPRTVLDRTVSSYTPTLRALIRAAATRPAADAVPPRAVAVAVDTADGDLPPLDGARREAEAIRAVLGDRLTVLDSASAAFGTVTAALHETEWAHFACHAVADVAAPSRSLLVLPDRRERPLTVAEVGALNLEHGELAFLSACSTAAADGRLPDEAIHLASAFHLAGFRQVIATLWPIRDGTTDGLIEAVYQRLVDAGGRTADAAQALREAIRETRAVYLTEPSVWAAFTHTGAGADPLEQHE